MDAEQDRRDAERAPITLRVDYRRLNTFFADYTKNISRGGTYIKTERPLEVGTKFCFVLVVPARGTDPSETVELKGVVRWVVPTAVATLENPAGMGIQFVFDTDEERTRLVDLVTRLMHSALGPHLAGKLLAKT